MGFLTPSTPRQRSLAWPLAAVYAALVVYATLYPFEGWRSQGDGPWAYLAAPWPRYWTAFDLWSNLLGYVPLGLLLALAVARSGAQGWTWWAWLLGFSGAAALSLVLEGVQSYLPMRVPSTMDWLANAAGAAGGASLAWAAHRWRLLAGWSRFRRQWLIDGATPGVVVLLLWPWAVLYPAPVPFGVGHVWSRAEAYLASWLQDTPFITWLPEPMNAWVLSPLAEALLVALSVWVPCLLAYALLRTLAQRLWFVAGWAVVVPCTGALSAALTYGPAHAWAWLSAPVWLGLLVAATMCFLSLALSRRAAALLMLPTLAYAIGLLNRAPEAPYFAQSLAIWEQGRFIRFHGLSQWLGWLWPYAAFWIGLRLALRRSAPAYNPGA
ncbi:MAG: hypothetical protein RJA09_1392 [Pseudomonadota bacterium]